MSQPTNQPLERPNRRGGVRGFPWALCGALAVTLCVGLALLLAAPLYTDSRSLMYLEKMRRAEEGPPVDVMILGDSQTVAAVRPEVLADFLPPGTRIYNFGAPAMAPSGGEVMLRRYLAAHPPPKLLVMGFMPMMYGDRRGEFERFTLKDALGLREVLLASWADGRPAYLLGWLSTRLGSVRHREGLASALWAAALDRVPALRDALDDWLGFPEDHPLGRYRFEWLYTARTERNRALRQELADTGGWHYWKENAYGGRHRRGTPGWKPRGPTPSIEPFEPSPRERAAVERILSLCAEHGIAVHFPTMPHSHWFARALRAGPGETALRAFWAELAARPGVTVGGSPTRVYPPPLFSDSTHLRPKGAERFSRELGRALARVWARGASR